MVSKLELRVTFWMCIMSLIILLSSRGLVVMVEQLYIIDLLIVVSLIALSCNIYLSYKNSKQ